MAKQMTNEQIQKIGNAVDKEQFASNARLVIKRLTDKFDPDKYYVDIMERLGYESSHDDFERIVDELFDDYFQSHLLDNAEECFEQLDSTATALGFISEEDCLNDEDVEAVAQYINGSSMYELICLLGGYTDETPNADHIWELNVEYSDRNWYSQFNER